MDKKCFEVVLVCVSLRGGGTERVVSRLANFLVQRHSVAIVTLVQTAPFYPLDSRIHLAQPVRSAGKSKIGKVGSQLRHLRGAFKRLRPKICCIFGEDIAGGAAFLARVSRVPRILVSTRGTPNRSLEGWNGWINPRVFAGIDSLIVQTHRAQKELSSVYRATKFRVCPNPVHIPESVVPLEQRPKNIIYVASIGRKKNQQELIQAFALCRERSEWRLVLVGDGPNRPAMEKLAGDLEIVENVIFLGEREDVPELLQSAQIFAFPSLSEGFPNALAEAMAHGCACISYDCPTGPAELIHDGNDGRLIPFLDSRQFQLGLRELMQDTSLRRKFSENARVTIRRFAEDIVFTEWERILTGINYEGESPASVTQEPK